MGSSKLLPGEQELRKPLFPRAKLLTHSREVATLESLHPMQWAWYVDGGLDGVDPESLVLFDGDIELGVGISLIWTPGHTDGNHSLCINTPMVGARPSRPCACAPRSPARARGSSRR
jgi:glyoxylase-like metal-dependent hydrolase (beta-lactamase superfamily II)